MDRVWAEDTAERKSRLPVPERERFLVVFLALCEVRFPDFTVFFFFAEAAVFFFAEEELLPAAALFFPPATYCLAAPIRYNSPLFKRDGSESVLFSKQLKKQYFA